MNAMPARVVDAETILALLDDGPRSTSHLAAACETTTKAMTTRLAQLAQAGRVQRHNGNGRWMRAVATPAPVICAPEAVLQQLEYAPKSEWALTEALHVPIVVLRITLAALAAARQVKPIGKLSQLRWARADWTANLAQSSRPQKHATPADPGMREALGSSSGTLPVNEFTAVTQKVKRPPVDADGQSWWTKHADPTLPRESFTNAARQRDAEMQGNGAWRRPQKVNILGLGFSDG